MFYLQMLEPNMKLKPFLFIIRKLILKHPLAADSVLIPRIFSSIDLINQVEVYSAFYYFY